MEEKALFSATGKLLFYFIEANFLTSIMYTIRLSSYPTDQNALEWRMVVNGDKVMQIHVAMVLFISSFFRIVHAS